MKKLTHDDITSDYKRCIVTISGLITEPDVSSSEVKNVVFYVPGYAMKDAEDNVVLKFESIHHYDSFRCYKIYHPRECPDLYDFNDFDTRLTMMMALGGLVGRLSDDNDDTSAIRPVVDRVASADSVIFEKWWRLSTLYDYFENSEGKKLKTLI